jgi:hypothetical protein
MENLFNFVAGSPHKSNQFFSDLQAIIDFSIYWKRKSYESKQNEVQF